MANDEVHDLSEDGEEVTSTETKVSELDQVKEALEEEKKKYLYLRADFDNYRKQSIKERSDLVKYGGEPVIREMLTILDDLERAASSELTADTLANYKNGIDLIVETFKKKLATMGVEAVDSKGQPFDPGIHEALSSINDPNQEPNSVVEVFRKPYRLHGKLIRPGQVVVNTAKKES